MLGIWVCIISRSCLHNTCWRYSKRKCNNQHSCIIIQYSIPGYQQAVPRMCQLIFHLTIIVVVSMSLAAHKATGLRLHIAQKSLTKKISVMISGVFSQVLRMKYWRWKVGSIFLAKSKMKNLLLNCKVRQAWASIPISALVNDNRSPACSGVEGCVSLRYLL